MKTLPAALIKSEISEFCSVPLYDWPVVKGTYMRQLTICCLARSAQVYLILTIGFCPGGVMADRMENSLVQSKIGIVKFDQLEISKFVSKKILRTRLQQFVALNYQRAFRYLGDRADFFHGHFLFSEPQLHGPTPSNFQKPLAILYHTQEEAYYFSKFPREKAIELVVQDSLGGMVPDMENLEQFIWPTDFLFQLSKQRDYRYVNSDMRNWIQWMDGGQIVNATQYVDESRRTPQWSTWETRQHTIVPEMLSLGFTVGEQMQFPFSEVRCGDLPLVVRKSDRFNNIMINVPGTAVPVCLLFQDNACFYDDSLPACRAQVLY